MQEEGDQYAELARAVYAAAERERWTNQQTFKMLNNPQEFIKFTEGVSEEKTYMESNFQSFVASASTRPA